MIDRYWESARRRYVCLVVQGISRLPRTVAEVLGLRTSHPDRSSDLWGGGSVKSAHIIVMKRKVNRFVRFKKNPLNVKYPVLSVTSNIKDNVRGAAKRIATIKLARLGIHFSIFFC